MVDSIRTEDDARMNLPVDKEVTVSIFLNPPLHCVEMVGLGLGRVCDIATIAVQEYKCMYELIQVCSCV